MNEYISSDIYRYYGEVSCKAILKAVLRNSSFRAMLKHRLYNMGGGYKLIGTLLYLATPNAKIQIPPRTKIGCGLYIAHGGPCVINGSAEIGNNVNLSQFVTIGANDRQAAIIGDNVYIGPNVCIVENVKIGNNVTIGAGSVVVKDVPDNATIAGNPARILNYNNPGRYIHNEYAF